MDGLQYKETHDPTISAPTVSYWTVDPNSLNPEIVNPNDIDFNLINPDIVTPRIRNESLGVVDPNLMYSGALDMTSYTTPRIRNADLINPRIRNTDVMAMSAEDNTVTDVEWTVKNEGNTASSYTFQTISKIPLPEGIYAQLLTYKVHYTPGVDESGCALKQIPHHELISNIINPRIRNPRIRNLNILNPDVISADIENVTFSVPPGGEVKVILRLFKPGAA